MHSLYQSRCFATISSISFNDFSLHHILKNVYMPLMIACEDESQRLNPDLSRILGQIQAGLLTVIGRMQSSVLYPIDRPVASENYLETIFEPLDELDYWSARAKHSGSCPENTLQMMHETMEKIRPPLVGLDVGNASPDWEPAEEFIDMVVKCLKDVWLIGDPSGWTMSDGRIDHFIDVTGRHLVSHVEVRRLLIVLTLKECVTIEIPILNIIYIYIYNIYIIYNEILCVGGVKSCRSLAHRIFRGGVLFGGCHPTFAALVNGSHLLNTALDIASIASNMGGLKSKQSHHPFHRALSPSIFFKQQASQCIIPDD